MPSTPPSGFMLLVMYNHMCEYTYGVTMISRLLKIIGLLQNIVSFIRLFCKRNLQFEGAY